MRTSKISLFSVVLLGGVSLIGGLAFANILNSSVVVGNAAPTISGSVIMNHNSQITLVANATVNVDVNATIADNNGCADITGGTTTILLYRNGVGSSSCFTTQDNLNCYKATVFTASSTCGGGGPVNTTTTFAVQYIAQSTDGSSTFSGQGWRATLNFTDSNGATTTGDSATNTLQSLTAVNITTSSINYGTLAASSTSATNSTTTLTNAGDTSSTLNLKGTAFISGGNNFATTSQHYATASIGTYGTGDTALTDSDVSVTGFKLTAPTTTSANVTGTIFWMVGVPGGTPTGTYTATTTFTPIFST